MSQAANLQRQAIARRDAARVGKTPPTPAAWGNSQDRCDYCWNKLTGWPPSTYCCNAHRQASYRIRRATEHPARR